MCGSQQRVIDDPKQRHDFVSYCPGLATAIGNSLMAMVHRNVEEPRRFLLASLFFH
jgi:hypothetical protein